jgi:hypothetical protein
MDLLEAWRCGGATLGGRVETVPDEVAVPWWATLVIGYGGGGVGEVRCTTSRLTGCDEFIGEVGGGTIH